MRLKAFKNIGDTQPIDQEVSVVLIEGKQGQPVAVAADMGNGAIMMEMALPGREAQFNRLLQTLGFDKVVIVDDLSKDLVPMDKAHQMPKLFGSV